MISTHENKRQKRKGRTRSTQHDRNRVKQPLEALVRMVYSVEQVREDVGDEEVADAERECGCEHEAVAPGEAGVREDAATRDGDRGEEEGCYAAEDRVRDW